MSLLTFFLLSFFSAIATAQDSAALAADLQSAAPSHWPAIEALLKTQRAELTAAHVASLAAANADTATALKAAAAREAEAKTAQAKAEAEAKTAQAKAEADLAALKQRIDAVLNGLLTQELQTGEGPKAELLRKLIAEAGKSDAELKREALAAEIAAKQAELNKLQP